MKAKRLPVAAKADFSARMTALRAVVSSVNKELKKDVVALAADGLVGDVQGVVPTGMHLLDLMLHGGIPLGRMVEISGRPGLGKSTLAAHILSNCQKMGGTAIVLDSENSWTSERVRELGLDPAALIQFEARTIEEGFNLIELTLKKLNEVFIKDKEKAPVIIVWDTIAASPCARDIDPSKVGTAMDKPKAIHIGLKKIIPVLRDSRASLVLINQIITKMMSFGGPSDDTPGGWGIKFGASQAIRLSTPAQGKIVIGGEHIGNVIRVRMTKNKIPGRRTKDYETRLSLLFETGFNDAVSNLMFLSEGQTITGSSKRIGGLCSVVKKLPRGIFQIDYNGEEYKPKISTFKNLVDSTEGMSEWLHGLVETDFLKPISSGDVLADDSDDDYGIVDEDAE